MAPGFNQRRPGLQADSLATRRPQSHIDIYITFFKRVIFFPDDIRIQTNEDQACKRTAVYLLEDHKVTVAVTVTLWCSSQRFSHRLLFCLVYYQAVSIIDLPFYIYIYLDLS